MVFFFSALNDSMNKFDKLYDVINASENWAFADLYWRENAQFFYPAEVCVVTFVKT